MQDLCLGPTQEKGANHLVQFRDVVFRQDPVLRIQFLGVDTWVAELKKVEELPRVVLKRCTCKKNFKREFDPRKTLIQLSLIVLQALSFVNDETSPRDSCQNSSGCVIIHSLIRGNNDMAPQVRIIFGKHLVVMSQFPRERASIIRDNSDRRNPLLDFHAPIGTRRIWNDNKERPAFVVLDESGEEPNDLNCLP